MDNKVIQGAVKNREMCTYMQVAVVYVQFLRTYK